MTKPKESKDLDRISIGGIIFLVMFPSAGGLFLMDYNTIRPFYFLGILINFIVVLSIIKLKKISSIQDLAFIKIMLSQFDLMGMLLVANIWKNLNFNIGIGIFILVVYISAISLGILFPKQINASVNPKTSLGKKVLVGATIFLGTSIVGVVRTIESTFPHSSTLIIHVIAFIIVSYAISFSHSFYVIRHRRNAIRTP